MDFAALRSRFIGIAFSVKVGKTERSFTSLNKVIIGRLFLKKVAPR